MKNKLLIALVCLLLSSWTLAEATQGDVAERCGKLIVWHTEANAWITPEEYFQLELKRLKGPTYGRVTVYPAYNSVKEWETLIDILPDGRTCPMVFFHQRWRRLPDVLALDTRLRNYGGCKDVFKH